MQHDYIIVGQGIAGTLVAHFLTQQGKKIALIDANHQGASSTVAAGLINPITGRRFVKSWEIDQLIPFAKKTYQELEKKLGIAIFFPKKIAMIFGSTKVENDWLARSADADIQSYISPDFESDFYSSFLQKFTGGVEFEQGARVRLKNLLEAYKKVWQEEQTYLEEKFDFQQLICHENGLKYRGIEAANIIFCEGYQATQNPYFNYLPFNLAKGEILIVKIPNYTADDKVVKHGVFIIPLGENLYWVGSSYLRNYEDEKPTLVEKENLKARLQKSLKLPFEIVAHKAAIRPTVKDRRPFIGQHPKHKNMYIFNGMGAKGSYLTPYFAQHFVHYLLDNNSLNREVNIERHLSYYPS